MVVCGVSRGFGMPKRLEKNAFPTFDSLKKELSHCRPYAPTSITLKKTTGISNNHQYNRVVALGIKEKRSSFSRAFQTAILAVSAPKTIGNIALLEKRFGYFFPVMFIKNRQVFCL
jgi:hypothetical protein